MTGLVIDQWSVLRRNLRTRDEHVEQIEETRARRGIEHEPCPILELMKVAPFDTIHDVIRVEAFCAAHPIAGPIYLCDVVETAGWFNDPWAAAMIQLHAVAQLLELHEPDVVAQRLNVLLLKPGLVMYSAEAMHAVIGWIAARHPNPKRFFSQPGVQQHLPIDVDLTDVVDRDFPELDLVAAKHAPREVRGANGSARVTWRVGPGDLALDYDELRDVSRRGRRKILDWFAEQSKAGDQLAYFGPNAITAKHVHDAAGDKASRLLSEAPLRLEALAEGVTNGVRHADPSKGLRQIMTSAHSAHLAGHDPDGHWGILASILAGCIRDYDPAGDHAHAAEVDRTIRARNGLEVAQNQGAGA